MKACELQNYNKNFKGELEIENCDYSIPLTIIQGKEEGPTVLFSAGIHCAEYNGIHALIELSNELQDHLKKGKVILLPLICKSGFEHRTMSLVYEDNKNLNRIFPGNVNGTIADKIAYTLSTYVLPYVDYHVDLHGGDGYEELTPLVFYAGAFEDDAINQRSFALVKNFNVKYLIKSYATTGGFYQTSASLGAASILLERGGMGKWCEEEVQEDKDDLYRLLASLDMVDPSFAKPLTAEQINIEQTNYIRSNKTGCWLPSFHAGETFHKGDVLGVITDYFGNVIDTVYAEFDGVALYQTRSLCTIEKGALIAYGKL